eukprot:CAMPEP_0169203374 /NCGR_PEP_ID=MMETSP1016-20121227/11434_1 /TAXON_ID=342587 /ORGANISM="Karlodinium micrum, Strain CCMP2283" /LENGTH=61 /DNA_ID=CAMNT_0009280417 /DNA_START=461 /DNA_END=646 /DNA_ORIENTATION=+
MTREDIAFLKQQDNAVSFNIFMLAVWVGFSVTALTGVAGVAYRKLRAPAESNGYAALLACE